MQVCRPKRAKRAKIEDFLRIWILFLVLSISFTNSFTVNSVPLTVIGDWEFICNLATLFTLAQGKRLYLFLKFKYSIVVTEKAVIVSTSFGAKVIDEVTMPLKTITTVKKGTLKSIVVGNNSAKAALIFIANNDAVYSTIVNEIK